MLLSSGTAAQCCNDKGCDEPNLFGFGNYHSAFSYEAMKYSAEVTKLGGPMSTGKCPPSPASWLSIHWGLTGLGDGMNDWTKYVGRNMF